MSAPWHVLLDFDGTITTVDAEYVIADLVYPSGPKHRFYLHDADEHEAMRLGTMAYFDRYLATVRLEPAALARWALQVPVRPGVHLLVDLCGMRGWALTVLSEGLDAYILPILATLGMDHLPTSLNRMLWNGQAWRAAPAQGAVSCGRCMNCKGEHVRRAQRAGQRVAVVGNGVSDLCGAREADLVLARDSLAQHCQREGIAHHVWTTYEDIVRVLQENAG